MWHRSCCHILSGVGGGEWSEDSDFQLLLLNRPSSESFLSEFLPKVQSARLCKLPFWCMPSIASLCSQSRRKLIETEGLAQGTLSRRPPSPLQPGFLVLLSVGSDSRTWKGESGISPGSARLHGVLSELSGVLSGARPGGNLLSEFPESKIPGILQHIDGSPGDQPFGQQEAETQESGFHGPWARVGFSFPPFHENIWVLWFIYLNTLLNKY